MQRKLRVGVIGAGAWTVSSHLPNLVARSSDIVLDIVNRRDPQLVDQVRAEFGFRRATTDWRDVIDAHPDLVVIGSPASEHYEQAKAALDNGAHVLCEKPLTIRPDHAWDLVKTADRVGRALIVAFGWNYTAMAVQAHDLLRRDGGIGEVEHLSIYMESSLREMLDGTATFDYGDPRYVQQASTWSDPSRSGGGYAQAQLSHALGLALWLFDLRAHAAFALMSATRGAPVELHDAIVARFDGGAIATIAGASGHQGAAGGRHAVDIRAVGRWGQFRLDLRDDILTRYRGPNDDLRVDVTPGSGAYDCRGPIDALVDAGLGRPSSARSTGELGARTVELLDAAYRSHASGVLEPVRGR